MQRLIGKHGHCPLAQQELQPFHMLANSIISQQLSIKAAGAIRQRLEAPFIAEKFLLISRDAGLQRAARLLYGKKRKSKTLLPRVAEAWRPYRSVASWYLWRSLEEN
ncbi:MAG: hypothetical protein ACREQO_05780 [Candidatus Binatia bacterium]